MKRVPNQRTSKALETEINLECSRNRVETGMAGSQRVVEKLERHEVRERQGPNHAGPDSWEVVVVSMGRSYSILGKLM